MGTGDFTHPAWRVELEDKLVPAEPGLFRLRPELERAVAARLSAACGRAMPRFMLSVEISTIYKKADARRDVTRKVHHLVYAPDLATVDALRGALGKIGNLRSDGRPILGLDSRDLLEIVLSTRTVSSGQSEPYLVPAHVWTPWFAALGSKSGFDRIEDCYGDLAGHVFAVETGLSSDPEMNWRLSSLDRYALVSSSDAHSPAKLGREATAFDCELGYDPIRRALETRRGLVGTVEFFPEEGKYHLDGHRKCGVVLAPEDTRARDGLCPACGRPVTVGVMHRIQELADRPAGFRPEGAAPFRSLIPLPEVLAEIARTGAGSTAVARTYEALLARVGDELSILERVPIEELRRAGGTLIAEAVARMRAGRVIREPGYDGEYGVIRLFDDGELAPGQRRGRGHEPGQGELALPGLGPEAEQGSTAAMQPAAAERSPAGGGNSNNDTTDDAARTASPAGSHLYHGLSELDLPGRNSRGHGSRGHVLLDHDPNDDDSSGGRPGSLTFSDLLAPGGLPDTSLPPNSPDGAMSGTRTAAPRSRYLDALDPDQRRAAALTGQPLLIVAGPGTGKTRTLTHRIAHMVDSCGARPESCLAVTFTNRATRELRERLVDLVPSAGHRVAVATFHGLALSMLREHRDRAGLHRGFRIAGDDERARLLAEALGCAPRTARSLLARLSARRRSGRRWSSGVRAGDQEAADPGDGELRRVQAAYVAAMERAAALDFDELMGRACSLLADHPDVRHAYRERYRSVSIDEYQDIDGQQYELVRQLCPPDADVCAIGDPDQAIYGFRGADVRFFLRFRDDYPGAREVRLTRSYRSTSVIVDAAMQEIAPGSLVAGRALSAVARGGARVRVVSARSERAEAEHVVHTIERLIGGTSFFSLDSGRLAGGPSGGGPAGAREVGGSAPRGSPGTLGSGRHGGDDELAAVRDADSCDRDDAPGAELGFSDFAVLYRTGAQAAPLVEAFTRSGMPFQHRSDARLADVPGVQALLAAVRASDRDGEGRDAALSDRLSDAARLLRTEAMPARGPRLADDGGLVSREELTAAVDLLAPLSARCDTLEELEAEIALGVEVDAWDPRADRVSLLTLHAAKGLEFPVVFVVGCEDGILPLRFGSASADGGDGDDEERRLLFVGITRAQQRLYLTRARRRIWRGATRELAPCPFLADIDGRLTRRITTDVPRRAQSGRQQLALF